MRLFFIILLFFSKFAFANSYDLNHFKNSVRVVNFWAMWCESCKEELKEFEVDLKKNANLHLVLINIDSDFEKAKEHIAKHDFGDRMLLVSDPEQKLAEKFELDAFPTSFVVGKDNEIKKIFKGFEKGKSKEIFTEASRWVSP